MPRNCVLKGEGFASPSDPLEKDIGSLASLRECVSSAYERVETVDWATLMVASPLSLHPVQGDPHVREIDALQCAENDGPAFEALRTRRICRIPSTTSSTVWPDLREMCRRLGVMSMASLPIMVDGVVVATLNLYSCDYHAFGPAETRAALSLVEQASQLIAGSMSRGATADV